MSLNTSHPFTNGNTANNPAALYSYPGFHDNFGNPAQQLQQQQQQQSGKQPDMMCPPFFSPENIAMSHAMSLHQQKLMASMMPPVSQGLLPGLLGPVTSQSPVSSSDRMPRGSPFNMMPHPAFSMAQMSPLTTMSRMSESLKLQPPVAPPTSQQQQSVNQRDFTAGKYHHPASPVSNSGSSRGSPSPPIASKTSLETSSSKSLNFAPVTSSAPLPTAFKPLSDAKDTVDNSKIDLLRQELQKTDHLDLKLAPMNEKFVSQKDGATGDNAEKPESDMMNPPLNPGENLSEQEFQRNFLEALKKSGRLDERMMSDANPIAPSSGMTIDENIAVPASVMPVTPNDNPSQQQRNPLDTPPVADIKNEPVSTSSSNHGDINNDTLNESFADSERSLVIDQSYDDGDADLLDKTDEKHSPTDAETGGATIKKELPDDVGVSPEYHHRMTPSDSEDSQFPMKSRDQMSPFSAASGEAMNEQALASWLAASRAGPVPPDGRPLMSQGNEIFYCHLCSYSGTSKFHFNSHMNSHFEHRCPHCDYTSRTEGRLKRHIKDFHSEVPPESFAGQKSQRTPGRPKVYRCKQCEFTAMTKVEFWVHARTHIKDDKVLQCPKCPFVTEYKHHLEYHLRNHFGSKPFKCTKCNYSCVNKSMLNSHMKSHTNVYQYRCADCTYATKYCHSLKLHLRKYNHKPATILNLDGSLPPEDNSLSLLEPKRGPPRGPRTNGGKNDEIMSPLPGGPNPLPIPGGMHSMPPFAGLNGGMLPSMYWPLMSQMMGGNPHLPPPLIPASSLGPLGLGAAPFSDGGKFGLNLAGVSAGSTNGQFKCNLCEYSGENKDSLNKHMLKVHAAAENQDLFNAFGLSSDAIEEQISKTDANKQDPSTLLPPGGASGDERSALRNMPPSWPLGPLPSEAVLNEMRRGLPELFYNGSNAYPFQLPKQTPTSLPTMSADQKSTSSPPTSNKEQSKPPASAGSPPPKSSGERLVNGEIPLDLTKPKSDARSSFPGGIPIPNLDLLMAQEEAQRLMMQHTMMQSPQFYSRKRRLLEQMELDEQTKAAVESEDTIQRVSPSLSPTPRKRSRKGKAYKLDTLCMKLQEQGSTSPSGYDSMDEEMHHHAAATTEHPSSTPHSRESGATDLSSVKRKSIDETNIDYREIHDSLSKLNSETGTIAREKYGGFTSLTSPPRPSSPVNQTAGKDLDTPLMEMHRMVNGTLGNKSPVGKLTSGPENGLAPSIHGHTAGGHAISMKGEHFECQYCEISFRDCVMYTMHMGYHGFRDPYHCNQCGFHAKDKVDFFLHIARVAHM